MHARDLAARLVLTGCLIASLSPGHAATSAGAGATAMQILPQHHWQLRDAVDKDNQRLDRLFGAPGEPLQLDFADGRISVRHACNPINGRYKIVDGRLDLLSLQQTMMACTDAALQQREQIIKSVLQGKPMLILSGTGDMPVLTLAADDGHSLTFVGKPEGSSHP